MPEQQLQPGCRYRPRRACYEDRAGHSGEHRRPRTRQAPMSATMQERGSSMSVPGIREQPIGCWLLVSAGEMANHYAYRRNRRNIVQITPSPDADRPPSVLGEEASPQRTLRPVDGSAAEGSVVMSHAKRIKDAADNARPGPGTGEQSVETRDAAKSGRVLDRCRAVPNLVLRIADRVAVVRGNTRSSSFTGSRAGRPTICGWLTDTSALAGGQRMKSRRAWLTSPAWVQEIACGPPAMRT